MSSLSIWRSSWLARTASRILRGDRALAAGERVLHELLGDRRAALATRHGRGGRREGPERAPDVDAAVGVEAPVLGRDHGLLQDLRDVRRLDGDARLELLVACRSRCRPRRSTRLICDGDGGVRSGRLAGSGRNRLAASTTPAEVSGVITATSTTAAIGRDCPAHGPSFSPGGWHPVCRAPAARAARPAGRAGRPRPTRCAASHRLASASGPGVAENRVSRPARSWSTSPPSRSTARCLAIACRVTGSSAASSVAVHRALLGDVAEHGAAGGVGQRLEHGAGAGLGVATVGHPRTAAATRRSASRCSRRCDHASPATLACGAGARRPRGAAARRRGRGCRPAVGDQRDLDPAGRWSASSPSIHHRHDEAAALRRPRRRPAAVACRRASTHRPGGARGRRRGRRRRPARRPGRRGG